VVGFGVTKTVLDILNSGEFHQDFNHTNVILTFKVVDRRKLAEFRPISLCNMVHK